MISRAQIIQIMDDYHVKVRIPRFNKGRDSNGSTPDNELSIAVVSTLPGHAPRFRVGDMVLVGFEDDDTSTPVVIGMFFNSKVMNSTTDVEIADLTVGVTVTLPEDTKIGEVSSNSIKMLQNLNVNVSDKFSELDVFVENSKKDIADMQLDIKDNASKITGTATTASSNSKAISDLKSSVATLKNDTEELLKLLNQSNSALSQRITDNKDKAESNEEEIEKLKQKIDQSVEDLETSVDKLSKSIEDVKLSANKGIISSSLYGTSLPSNPVPGQIYFYLEG